MSYIDVGLRDVAVSMDGSVHDVQRDGFIIEPFTASIATAAVAYTLTRDDYTFDAAYDINRNAAFLSAGKRYNDKTAAKVRSSWALEPT